MLKHVARAAAVAAVGRALLTFEPEYEAQYQAFMRRYSDKYGDLLMKHRKYDLFKSATGDIIDLNAGTGINVRYLPSDDVVTYTAVEPNKYFLPALEERQMENPAAFKAVTSTSLDYLRTCDANSIDTVVTTYGLAGEKEHQVVLKEIARVLKPGGRLLFLEKAKSESGLCSLIHKVTSSIFPRLDLSEITQAGLVLYAEDWSSKVDPSHPRRGVEVIRSPPLEYELKENAVTINNASGHYGTVPTATDIPGIGTRPEFLEPLTRAPVTVPPLATTDEINKPVKGCRPLVAGIGQKPILDMTPSDRIRAALLPMNILGRPSTTKKS